MDNISFASEIRFLTGLSFMRDRRQQTPILLGEGCSFVLLLGFWALWYNKSKGWQSRGLFFLHPYFFFYTQQIFDNFNIVLRMVLQIDNPYEPLRFDNLAIQIGQIYVWQNNLMAHACLELVTFTLLAQRSNQLS